MDKTYHFFNQKPEKMNNKYKLELSDIIKKKKKELKMNMFQF